MTVMIIIFVLFILLTAIFLLPSQVFQQKQALQDVENSLTIRLQQLKIEFQLRTKELARRLKREDLAQDEWQSLTDELALQTSSSIELTQHASQSKKTEGSRTFVFFLLIIILIISFSVYQISGSLDQAKRKNDISLQLKSNQKLISQLTKITKTENTQTSFENLYLALRGTIEIDLKDTNAWRALALFYAQIRQPKEALQSINKAIALEPDNLDIKIELAQIYAVSKDVNNLNLSSQILISILKEKPKHERVLMMLGFNEINLGNYQGAIDAWKMILNQNSPESKSYKMLQQSIAFAETKLLNKIQQAEQTKLVEQTKQTEQTKQASIEDSKITVKINIPKAIRNKLSGNEVLFVFAKAISGPRFPLAVVRIPINDLVDEVILSDANAMQAEFSLSKFPQVNISARISKSGNAIAQAEDFNTNTIKVSAPFKQKIVTLKF